MTGCHPLPSQTGTAAAAAADDGGGGVDQAVDADAGMDDGAEVLLASWALYLKA